MRLRLIKLRDVLSDSFWFVPALMTTLAMAAAFGTVALDQSLGNEWLPQDGLIWAGGADGARAVMSTVAGSLITVTSIVFSLTITTLAQATSRFGSRVLRNFTSDRGVQFTLGTFVATFIYCLLVMRTVRSVEESEFVPYVAVNLGLLLTLGSLAVLIYFIHHISQGIQAENLIAEIGREFLASLPVLFPARIGLPDKEKEDAPPAPWDWKRAVEVPVAANGYLQRVDNENLMSIARRNDLVIRLGKRPGDFTSERSVLLKALPISSVTDEVKHALQDCFITGRHRTPHQDALYCIQQLVEVAAHALSPGINEPYTALTCIDWLGACLEGVAHSEVQEANRAASRHHRRVVARTGTRGRLPGAHSACPDHRGGDCKLFELR
jgi:uncharacterized membrane protein